MGSFMVILGFVIIALSSILEDVEEAFLIDLD